MQLIAKRTPATRPTGAAPLPHELAGFKTGNCPEPPVTAPCRDQSRPPVGELRDVPPERFRQWRQQWLHPRSPVRDRLAVLEDLLNAAEQERVGAQPSQI
jgi:hypothetical protein